MRGCWFGAKVWFGIVGTPGCGSERCIKAGRCSQALIGHLRDRFLSWPTPGVLSINFDTLGCHAGHQEKAAGLRKIAGAKFSKVFACGDASEGVSVAAGRLSSHFSKRKLVRWSELIFKSQSLRSALLSTDFGASPETTPHQLAASGHLGTQVILKSTCRLRGAAGGLGHTGDDLGWLSAQTCRLSAQQRGIFRIGRGGLAGKRQEITQECGADLQEEILIHYFQDLKRAGAPFCVDVCAQLWNGRKDNFLDPLHVISAHREPCRSISIAPTDRKFVSASDDSTIKPKVALHTASTAATSALPPGTGSFCQPQRHQHQGFGLLIL
eukprot:1146605-Pelagomonas_calceolata.AAC.1